MKHGQLDEDGLCVMSQLRPHECAGCRGDVGSGIPSATWKAKPAPRTEW